MMQQEQRDFTSFRVLRRYERWRKGDNAFMLRAMDAFKKLFGTDSPLVVQARTMGLSAANQCNVSKNYFMRLAMGQNQDLPDVARKK